MVDLSKRKLYLKALIFCFRFLVGINKVFVVISVGFLKNYLMRLVYIFDILFLNRVKFIVERL